MSLRATAHVRVWLFSALMAVVAVGLFVGPATSLPAAAPPVDVSWWVLAVAFGLAEAFVVHLDLRRDGEAVSLMEAPLVVGLAVLSPVGLLAARLTGGAVALVVKRRHDPTKLAVNLSLYALEIAVGLVVFRGILSGAPPVGGRVWLAAGVTIAALNLISSTAISVVLWILEGRVATRMLRESATVGTFLAVFAMALGVLVLAALWDGPSVLAPLAVVSLLSFMAYRAHLDLRSRHVNLELLLRFTSATARSGETRVAAAGMLSELCEILRAEAAVLVLIDDTGGISFRIGMMGGIPVADDAVALTDADVRWCRRAAAMSPHQLGADPDDLSAASRLLGVALIDEAILAPLGRAAADAPRGLVLLANRRGANTRFDRTDLVLLAELAHHATVALENGRVVERLREEAATKAHQASHDSLTGLPNRILLEQRMAEALGELRPGPAGRTDGAVDADADGRSPGAPADGVAVLLADLDGFKAVNDRFGHAVGDALLRYVAARLRNAVRPGDTVARIGGDEFALVLPGVSDDEVPRAIADRISLLLSDPCTVEGVTVQVGVSIGIARSPADGHDGRSLLQHADAAMYEAKRSGGGARVHRRRPHDGAGSPADRRHAPD